MEKNIKIKTIQIFNENEQEQFSFEYKATIDEKENKKYIRYIDENKINNYIKVGIDEVVINNANKLIFREKTTYSTKYITALNTIDLSLYTEDVKIDKDEITIKYDLYMDGKIVCKTIYNMKIVQK